MPDDLPDDASTGKHRPVRPHGAAETPGHPTGEFPLPVEMSSGPPAVPGYDVVGEIGRGGSAVVVKAWDVKLKRFVALKMIAPGLERDPSTRQRFLDEAKSHARLEHPNIVPVLLVGTVEDWPFFVLEFCGGGSLARKLSGNPILPRVAAELMAKVADGLAHAHSLQIIHRDLKPANIMLTAEGEPKIGDFGLAKKLGGDAGRATKVGVVVGTPNYLAPELLTGGGRRGSFATDIYSLGAILYECLTGRPPFKGATLVDTIDQIRLQRVIPPRRFERKVPQDLEAICLKCLNRDLSDRYATAGEVADDLRRFLKGERVLAKPWTELRIAREWATEHKSVAALLLITAMAVGAALAGVVLFFAAF